jgi:hypothetical protein
VVIWHFLLTVTGTNNEQSRWYAFWSGFGGNLAVVGAIAGLYYRHSCHTKGCWRIARQQIDGTTLHVCRRHHPDDAPSA